MLAGLQYDFNELAVSDSANVSYVVDDSGVVSQTLVNIFQVDNIQINPLLYYNNPNTDIITYVLLALLSIISAIWYFFPDRFLSIFFMKSKSQLLRGGESRVRVPGTLITVFFWINFIIATNIFILLFLKRFFAIEIEGLSDYQVVSFIFLTISGLFLYRGVIIFGAATIFQTKKLMQHQVVIGQNILFITGVLLVPVILVLLYSGGSFFIYLAIAAIFFLQATRLVQLVIIGKSSTIFSVLHIILYLCTLEIVPVLVLIRLIGNGSEI
ncbi:MAG: DUF4271 domain-containing protein [Bacteroidetes bacterium]|nr:DUF4271 domain-containing protein [Bacteroidota bacterium]MBL6944167.1 DUF4271 domain-containing protein [Bacteroidales bacterium]